MDEEELLLQGDDGAAVITDHLDEDQLLSESINGDAGSVFGESGGAVCKIESVDHEELDYEEEEEKEERESRFTSERGKKSPVRAPEDGATAAPKMNENTGVAARGNYQGRVMRGGAGFRGGMGGNFNMRGGMRMMAGGGSAGPISLLTSNIPPPMMMAGPGMGGPPMGKILVNPNFPVGAGLTLLPTPGPGGYGAPPMGLRGPMGAPTSLGPKVTLSIDGAPALAVPVNVPRMQPPQMGPGPGMSMPPPNLSMRPGGPPLILNPMLAPPPSSMRFPPGMGPPPMNGGMNMPPPGLAQMTGGAQNWNLMVEAFLGDKKSSGGDRSKKRRRRRSRSSSYSSSSDSESSYSESSRSRSRSRSPRKSRKRSSRGSRKHRKERSSGGGKGERGDRAGERRVFRTGPNSYRINPPANGSELPSLLDGMDRGGNSSTSRSRRVDRERQRENDSRDSARALGLDDDYLTRVEEQRRQREEIRRRRDRNDGAAAANRERSPITGRSRNDGNGSSARDARKDPEPVDESKRKAYLAVHVKNVSSLGDAALGRVKTLANDVGETKKVWRSADDVVTVIFVELDKAKDFMIKYNGKVLSGTRVNVGLEKVYLNLSEVHDR